MELDQMITAATTLSGLTCPSCKSHSFRKHGKHLGIQRYRCKNCHKTFKETVNTPLHWIHKKDLMYGYLVTMREKCTIRAAAARLGISKETSFAWRHKLLSSLNAQASRPASSPSGICQINLPHSYKGKRTIPQGTPPPSQTIIIADARGIPAICHLRTRSRVCEAAQLLVNTINPAVPIATVSANLLTRAAGRARCTRVRHPQNKKKLQQQTIQAVKKLDHWMETFHGVATKYLQQYWNWYRLGATFQTDAQFAAECLGQRQLLYFRQILKE